MKINVFGDFCPLNRVSELFEKQEYDVVLREVKEITSRVDYNIVNLECPVVSRFDNKKIEKFGPCLKCSSDGLDALKWAGIDAVTLANNHFLDYGESGAINTIKELNCKGVDYVGGGINLEESSKVLYKTTGGKTVGVINCCEHEFSIATERSAGSNPLNIPRQFYQIKEAKEKSDFVVLIIHGGHEHYNVPSPRMVSTYRFFVDCGADAVINHHQHCFCGYEVYNGKFIFYGLGNFCFDMKNRRDNQWTTGYGVELDFASELSFRLIPYIQCREDASIHFLEKEELDAFNATIKKMNQEIQSNSFVKSSFEDYSNKMRNILWSSCEPYSGRIMNFLFRKGILPSLFGHKRKIKMLNFISCESYHDLFVDSLNKEISSN